MTRSDAFLQALEAALDHFGDAAWLGAHSPLATPYVLGDAARGDAPARGQALRERLRGAAAALDAEARRFLEVAYFQRNPALTVVGLARQLHLSRAAFYRHRDGILPELARAFTARVQPALRLEAAPRTTLIGRTREREAAAAVLAQGGTVAIAGPAGIGKTTLGASLVQGAPAVFWYTVRPPLNDQFDTFVFALAAFLRDQGGALSWQQLVAAEGAVDAGRILGLLRHDLATLRGRALLAIDEIDLLRFDTSEHARLIHLLEELRPLAALLLMGQQLVIEPALSLVLRGLEPEDTHALLAAAGVPTLDAEPLARLREGARGSPALLRLFAALVAAGEPIESALRQMLAAPTLEIMVRRVWRRLPDEERTLLARICVHPGRAPADVYAADPAYARLIARELLRPDGAGGVSVPTFARDFVHAMVPVDVRAGLHLQAAREQEQRLDFTAAAWHYLAGREPAMAVWTWWRHRDAETHQGRGAAARAIFADVAEADLPQADDRRALALLRAGWHRALGDTEEGLAALDAAPWPSGHPATGSARLLRGQLLETRGRIDAALSELRQSLREFATTRERDAARAQTAIGFVHLRERELDQARRAALDAHVQALSFRGFVETQAGQFEPAQALLEQALDLARAGQANPALMREALSRLGTLCWQRGQTARARDLLGQALTLATEMGDTLSGLYLRINLAAAALTDGDAATALAQSRAGLAVAEPMGHAYLIAGLSVNAAEACLALGDPAEAERLARTALAQEETAPLPYALTALGRAQLAQRDPQAAHTLGEAVARAEAIEDRFARAHALHWRARAGDAASEPLAAAAFAALGVPRPKA